MPVVHVLVLTSMIVCTMQASSIDEILAKRECKLFCHRSNVIIKAGKVQILSAGIQSLVHLGWMSDVQLHSA